MKTAKQSIGRRATRRHVLAGAGGVAGLAGAVLAACGAPSGAPAAGQPTQAKGKVTYMSQGTDPTDEQRYKPLIDDYNAKKGPVTIELIQGDAGGGAVNAQGKLLTMVAGGTPPDAFWTHAYITPNLIKLGMLADINPYLKKDPDVKLSNYFEAPTKDYEADGKQYGLPREATTTIIVVNKELFQKNGVPVPNENWTWDDFLKTAQLLTKGEGSQQTFGAAGFAGPGSNVYFGYVKVWGEGGDVVDKTRTKFTLQQSPAVDQMQWIADLVTKYKVHPYGDSFPGPNAQDAWNAGRLGMFVQFSVYTTFNKAQFDWDIVPVPRGGKARVTRTASAGHSMTAAGKNKDAAWEIMRLLGSKAAYEHWTKLGLTIPTYKEVANGPLFLNPSQPPKSAKVALDAFAYARPEPISGDWGNVGSTIQTAMNDVYVGKTDAKAALTAIVPVVESLLTKTPAAPTAAAK